MKVISSWCDWKGSISWTRQVMMDIYKKAVRFVVKLLSGSRIASISTLLRTRSPLITSSLPSTWVQTRVDIFFSLSQFDFPLMNATLGRQDHVYPTSLLPARNFDLLGSPIAHSPSVNPHHASFEALSLPHAFAPLNNTLIPMRGGVLGRGNTEWCAIRTAVAPRVTPVVAHTVVLVIGAGGGKRTKH
ncbi:hypothetical protein BS47DRAFT_243105 [Hydnum rufescens UP504]|uniref:Uncharacterized protein n=1 Tax=Hydnum rufescens UP504 TaxID=1448309 RepID=A0A9P6AMJ3_9AGAM|nr:hypothetical protein BS47DRAFT_243105 [Hydnum rufescens UP504]